MMACLFASLRVARECGGKTGLLTSKPATKSRLVCTCGPSELGSSVCGRSASGSAVLVAVFAMATASDVVGGDVLSNPPAACRIVIDDLNSPNTESPSTIKLASIKPASFHDSTPADDEPAQNTIELSDFSEVVVSAVEPSDCVDDDSTACDDSECDVVYPKFGDWLGYNSRHDGLTWIAGGDLSWTSLEWFPALDVGETCSIEFGSGFHFLGGPTSTDLPPRLFDVQMARLSRKPLTDATTLDVKFGVGVFSDFETSARKGVRFPGHVVAHTQQSEQLATVLGVDVLDRDDITLLPVAGVIWQPSEDLILDIVFPRPKIQLRVNEDSAFYVLGELGGGTWAIQRADGSRDNATYHDLRVLCGSVHFGDESESVIEIGWTFDRELTYRSGRGDRNLDGAFVLRWQTLY